MAPKCPRLDLRGRNYADPKVKEDLSRIQDRFNKLACMVEDGLAKPPAANSSAAAPAAAQAPATTTSPTRHSSGPPPPPPGPPGPPPLPFPVLAEIVGVDLMAVAETTLFYISRPMELIGFLLHGFATGDPITAPPTLGFGTNAVGADDIIAPISLTGFLHDGDRWLFLAAGRVPDLAVGDRIYIGVDTAATTGGTATLTGTISILGWNP